MNTSLSLTTIVAGLLLSLNAFAQGPLSGSPPRPQGQAPAQRSAASETTGSSRIRAFDVAPDGQVRTLFLSNGSVVELAPGMGRALSVAVTRGMRVRVAGLRSQVSGQTILAATRVTLNGRTIMPDVGPEVLAQAGRPSGPHAGMPAGPGRDRERGPDTGPDQRMGPDVARVGPPAPDRGPQDTRRVRPVPPPPPPAANPAGLQGAPPPLPPSQSRNDATPPPPPSGPQAVAPPPAPDGSAPQ